MTKNQHKEKRKTIQDYPETKTTEHRPEKYKEKLKQEVEKLNRCEELPIQEHYSILSKAIMQAAEQ